MARLLGLIPYPKDNFRQAIFAIEIAMIRAAV